MEQSEFAPGGPGITPKWTSSSKSGIGTSYNSYSKVWFTISHGILNEIYYPRIDIANTRDFGFIVTDGNDFFSEEKRSTKNKIKYLAEGIPAFKLENTCVRNFYKIEKEIITDPDRDSVLQKITFIPLKRIFLFIFMPCLPPILKIMGLVIKDGLVIIKAIPCFLQKGKGLLWLWPVLYLGKLCRQVLQGLRMDGRI